MQQLVDNRYEIVRTIGSGGMADVFLAHDNVLDRDVALKVMNSRYASDDEFIERFRREAQSAAALSHPNIVSIYDRGESEDRTYYIAMEYLSGGTLKDRILKKGALPPKTAASVAAQIAEALKAAHDRDVVHRDIKPHNILITEGGDIKVTDFGIARAASSSTMTKTGAVMGTAHYISPEQAMGESVGPASDLYSLGVLLYEMLTGELPFDADTPIGIAMKHVNGVPDPPRDVNPEVPAGLNSVVIKLLQKHPEDRYASDEALIEDLERVSRGDSPTSAAETQVMKGLDRTSVLAAGAGHRTQTMPRTARGDERPKKKRGNFFPVFLSVILLALIGLGGYSLISSSTNAPPETNEAPEAAEIDVPDLDGLTLEEARDQVGEDFDITQGDEVNSAEAAGTILDQNPSSGGMLTEGSEIQVTTASGSNSVPEVVDLTRENATQEIRDAGFRTQVEERESDEADDGRVLSQAPGGGSNEEVDSEITITVGTGLDLISVPNIPAGSTQSDATSILQDANLILGSVTETESDTVAEGGVIDQNPSPGEEVEEDSAVDIVISSGPEQVEVPDVVGQDVITAQQNIISAGLGQTAVEAQSNDPAGTVISTSPSGGTAVDPGSTITITYSLGPPQEAPVTSTPVQTDDSTDPQEDADTDTITDEDEDVNDTPTRDRNSGANQNNQNQRNQDQDSPSSGSNSNDNDNTANDDGSSGGRQPESRSGRSATPAPLERNGGSQSEAAESQSASDVAQRRIREQIGPAAIREED